MSSYTVQIAEKLTGQRFEGRDFSGQDLSKKDMRGSIFTGCNFDNTNLTDANCEGSDFSSATFRKALMTRANFGKCKLANSVFEPDDCYGITLTMDCMTFQGMHIGQLWWYGWLVLMASAEPKATPVQGSLKGSLIAVIGADRYIKLRELFKRRQV